jgi:DNA invertase Pin-like site-specific DNA recombinase
MSRREYKTINRRIQRGRLASANEGKAIASTAPYGYEKIKLKNLSKLFILKNFP